MKNKKDNTPSSACTSSTCKGLYITDEDGYPIRAGCKSGGTGCTDCTVHEAGSSVIHDQPLIDATKKIKKILEDIPPHKHGHKLSFIHTSQGVLLAWLEHGITVPADAKVMIQGETAEADFVKGLKIKDWK